MLEKNDILLLLGKGHEDYQTIKNKKYPLKIIFNISTPILQFIHDFKEVVVFLHF